MSRSLPLSPATSPIPSVAADATDASLAPAAAELPESGGGPLAGAVQVFDPAMCCSTGICGPGVDPALLQLARDLRWLSAQGVTVERFGLAQEPQAFVSHARVAGLMQAFGDGALPAVLVNDAVLAHGRYPTRQELVAALAPAPAPSPAPATAGRALAVQEGAGGCCAPGSGCC